MFYVLRNIWISVLEFKSSICMDFKSNGLHTVVWQPPSMGYIKLNTDRSVWMQSGVSGCGGVIRDANGNWLLGISAKGLSIDVLHVELQAILHGLKLAWETGHRVICCEMDSYEAYCILSATNSANRDGLGVLCQEIRGWLNRDWTV